MGIKKQYTETIIKKMYKFSSKLEDKDILKQYEQIIERCFPNISNVSMADFETISQEIKTQLAKNEQATSVNKLINKTKTYLKKFAKFYINNGLDISNFEDELDALQCEFVIGLNNIVSRKTWFANYNSFTVRMNDIVDDFIVHLCINLEKEKAIEFKQLDGKTINLIGNRLYQKTIKDIKTEELRAELHKVFNSLGNRDASILSNYFLRESKNINCVQIAKEHNLSYQRVSQIINESIEIIRETTNPILKEYYTNSD